MIKIGVADDHNLLREGMVSLIKNYGTVEVVAEADSVQSTKRMLDTHPEIEIILCDIDFPDGNGFEVIEHIKMYNSKAKVIFLTMHDKSSYATKAIEVGAMGYLTKDAVKEELMTAITAVKNGRKYFSQNIMSSIVDNINKPQVGHDHFKKLLSKRELEVLELIIEGLDTHEIAEKLFISEKTAANYRISILQKCNVKNVVQLIKLYMQHA
jgi:DNA-binding NarL/FixJ family response regulator